MKSGTLLAIFMGLATAALIVIGVIWPVPTAVYYAGGNKQGIVRTASSPEAAVRKLGAEIRLRNWGQAYSGLANKAKFTEGQFQHDLTGYFDGLRTGATLVSVGVQPLHQSANHAEMVMKLHWYTVLGPYQDTRILHLVRNNGLWQVNWPLVKEQHVPPQVIPINYLRWDVIHTSPGEQWGAQNVAGPNVRIVDMHPVDRASGVYVMGELLNQDVVPAWVSVEATLLAKNGSTIASGTSFDMISHTLLPKQVTPFLIRLPHVSLSQVASIRMQPHAVLVSASADPIIEVEDQKYTPQPEAQLTGEVSNQSGEVVNFAHVLTTFYNQNGQVIWVGGTFVDRALLPQSPVPFTVPVPGDLARKVASEHTIVSTFSTGSVL